MTTFLLLDLANVFYRCRHAVSRSADSSEKVGLTLNAVFNSIAKCWREQKPDHLVVMLEGRSWRKDYYQPYKYNRELLRQAKKPAEVEEDKLFWDAHDKFATFLYERTNCTVLQHAQLEADDLIAGWIQNHPNDKHVIISTDSDFAQLMAANVIQYNAVTDELVTQSGIFNGRGKLVMDKKTKLPKQVPDPAWLLFEKCMRGDTGDNVFSAYPGVREKSTKNKVGLLEAFADRNNKGYAWNNLMLSRWVDHNDKEHRVLDDYKRNVELVDLTAQPAAIREMINKAVTDVTTLARPGIGLHFLKFCGKYELIKVSENANTFATILSAAYPGVA